MSAQAMHLRPPMMSVSRAPVRTMAAVRWRAQCLFGLILAMTYLLTVGEQQDQLTLAVIGSAAAISIVSPVTGLAMFVVIMPMQEPELLVPVRVDAILAASIALGCIFRLPRDRIAIKIHPGIALLIGYLAISAVSLLPAVSAHPADWFPSAANELLRIATGALLFLSATYLFRLVPYMPFLALALVGTTLAALLAIGDFAHNLPFEALYHGLLSATGSLRASGGFSDANYLGLFMASAAVFALGMLLIARRPWKLVLAPIVVLLFACVAVTFSRGAYLGLSVGVVVLAASRSRRLAVAVGVVAVALALTLYPMFLEARVGTEVNSKVTTALLLGEESRAAVVDAAFEMFASSPVFGVGFGIFHFVSPAYTGESAALATYSHNQFANILAEQGVMGIVMVAGVAVMLGSALVKSRSPLRPMALAMGATYLVLSLFINSTTSFQGSCLLWLVMAAALTPNRDTPVVEA